MKVAMTLKPDGYAESRQRCSEAVQSSGRTLSARGAIGPARPF